MKRVREFIGLFVYTAGIALLLVSAWVGGREWFNREFASMVKKKR